MQGKSKHSLSVLALVLVAAIWGFGYLGVQNAIDGGWSSLGILAFRGVVGGGLCLIFSFKEKWWKNKKFLYGAILSGAITFIGYLVQTEGQKRTSIPNCAFFTTLNVVMVPFIAAIFFKDKLRFKTIVAAVISLVGVGVLSFTGSEFSLQIGDLFNFIGALCFAIQIAYMGKLSKYNSPFGLAGVQLMVMGILGLIIMPFFGGEQHFGSGGWLGIIYVAVVSSFIAFFLQAACQQNVNSGTTAVIIAQESTFGTLFSVLLMHSPVTWNLLVGGSIVVLSVLIASVNFNFKKRKKVLEPVTVTDKADLDLDDMGIETYVILDDIENDSKK